MFITDLYIDGYGHFINYHIPLDQGLNLIHGRNESGKSTLLSFIRGMFFGFPIGKGVPLYLPITPNVTHGGRMVLRHEDKTIIISRTIGKRATCTVTIDDKVISEEVWKEILKTTDRRLFNAIFAIGLHELHELNTLTSDGVKDQIFSAGIVGAGKSAREAITETSNYKDKLYKGKGRTLLLNVLRKELENKQSELKNAQTQVKQYEKYRNEESQLRNKRDSLRSKIDDKKKKADHIQKVLDFWNSHWYNRLTLETELGNLDGPENFPEHLVEKVNTVSNDIKRVKQQIEDILEIQDSNTNNLKSHSYNQLIIENAYSIEALYRDNSSYRSKKGTLDKEKREMHENNDRLNNDLKYLGEGWDASRLSEFPLSLPVTDEVRIWEESINIANEKTKDAQHNLEQKVDEYNKLNNKVNQALQEYNADTNTPSPEILDQQQDLLYKIQQQCEQLDKTQQQITNLKLMAATNPSISYVPSSQTNTSPLLIFIALITAAVAMWRFLLNDFIFAVILGVLAVIIGIAWFLTRPRKTGTKIPQISVTDDSINTSKIQLETLETQAKNLETEILKNGESFGLTTIPNSYDINIVQEKITKYRKERTHYDNRLKDIESIRNELKILDIDKEKYENLYKDARSENDKVHADWQAWKQIYQIEALLTPQSVIDFFDSIRRSNKALQDIKNSEANISKNQLEITSYYDEVSILVHQLYEPARFSQGDLDGKLVELHEKLTAERENYSQYQTLSRQISTNDQNLKNLRTKLEELEEEEHTLFIEANVNNTEEFHIQHQNFKRKQDIILGISKIDDIFRRIFGIGEDTEDIRVDLSTGNVAQWQQTISDLQNEYMQMEQERDEIITRMRDAELNRINIEESSDIVRIETEIEAVKQEIVDVEEEWSLLAISEALLSETLQNFEREHQPKVLMSAGKYFKDVTDGKYIRLTQREEQDLDVIDIQEKSKNVTELSRGTAEQLYLCLRFGLAELISQKTDLQLPFVMDDILVNFDPIRADKVLEIISQFAEGHQIILFTCHPQTVESIHRITPSAHTFDLNTYKLPEMSNALLSDAQPKDNSWNVGSVEDRIIFILKNNATPLGKQTILEKGQISEAEWNMAIKNLKDSKKVTQTGEKRGATYRAI